ncbi:hypothetical protein MHU86_21622 [Fragilaria crotonensis]|nr:hypothetical protein MHU86_21622 [Fragilaria crotonensis]
MPSAILNCNYSTISLLLSHCKENHPEFPFIDLMGSDSPVPNYGESSSKCLHYPGCYAGYLPLSICDSLSCPNQIESVASNNIITFQQDNSTFSGPHFACLAVSTRRSSLLSDPTRTPDPRTKFLHKTTRKRKFLHQTNPKLQFYTTNTATKFLRKRHYRRKSNAKTPPTARKFSQQLISDAETTYDEHAQTTQQLPELTKSRIFTTKLARNKQFTPKHPQLASNCEINNWASKTLLRCIFRHSHAEKRKITSQSGRHQLEPTTSDFDNFFDDTQNYTYQKFSPQNLNPNHQIRRKIFRNPKINTTKLFNLPAEICQTYAKIT